jgi:hypothetical protein
MEVHSTKALQSREEFGSGYVIVISIAVVGSWSKSWSSRLQPSSVASSFRSGTISKSILKVLHRLCSVIVKILVRAGGGEQVRLRKVVAMLLYMDK